MSSAYDDWFVTGYDPASDPAMELEWARTHALRELAEALRHLGWDGGDDAVSERDDVEAVRWTDPMVRQAAQRRIREMSVPGRTGWMNQREAAEYVGVSTRSFQRHVAPHVEGAIVGSVRRYQKETLDSWLATQQEVDLGDTPSPNGTGSAANEEEALDARGRRILAELRPKKKHPSNNHSRSK